MVQLEEFVDIQNSHRLAKAVPYIETAVEKLIVKLSRTGAEVSQSRSN
jgi:chemotaxis receptor (MCP) glutamine deamidase CheD